MIMSQSSFWVLSCILLLLLTTSATGLNPDHCKCTFLVHRFFLTSGLCGKCALCYWNLFYFADNFQSYDSTMRANVAEYDNNFRKCARRIPMNPTGQSDIDCITMDETCRNETTSFFNNQCLQLYGPGNPEVLPPPEPVSDLALAEFSNKINSSWTLPPKFGDNTDYYYPRTCPSHHRSYEFTFYMLFDAASKKYGKSLTKPWTEELGYPQVATYMAEESLKAADAEVLKQFQSFGYTRENMNQRRFCGHFDVFVCVDESKGPEFIEDP